MLWFALQTALRLTDWVTKLNGNLHTPAAHLLHSSHLERVQGKQPEMHSVWTSAPRPEVCCSGDPQLLCCGNRNTASNSWTKLSCATMTFDGQNAPKWHKLNVSSPSAPTKCYISSDSSTERPVPKSWHLNKAPPSWPRPYGRTVLCQIRSKEKKSLSNTGPRQKFTSEN